KSIALNADGKILVGGTFTRIGGQAHSFFSRLTNDTAALQDTSVTSSSVTWMRGGSSPQFDAVTFEYSDDNVNYSPLGQGAPFSNIWFLTGTNLPIQQD